MKDKTIFATYIAVGGAALTLFLNFWWIPIIGFEGAAWATLVCYVAMTIASFVIGRKHYPIPYNLRKIVMYLGLAIALFFVFRLFDLIFNSSGQFMVYILNAGLIFVFLRVVFFFEGPVRKRD